MEIKQKTSEIYEQEILQEAYEILSDAFASGDFCQFTLHNDDDDLVHWEECEARAALTKAKKKLSQS